VRRAGWVVTGLLLAMVCLPSVAAGWSPAHGDWIGQGGTYDGIAFESSGPIFVTPTMTVTGAGQSLASQMMTQTANYRSPIVGNRRLGALGMNVPLSGREWGGALESGVTTGGAVGLVGEMTWARLVGVLPGRAFWAMSLSNRGFFVSEYEGMVLRSTTGAFSGLVSGAGYYGGTSYTNIGYRAQYPEQEYLPSHGPLTWGEWGWNPQAYDFVDHKFLFAARPYEGASETTGQAEYLLATYNYDYGRVLRRVYRGVCPYSMLYIASYDVTADKLDDTSVFADEDGSAPGSSLYNGVCSELRSISAKTAITTSASEVASWFTALEAFVESTATPFAEEDVPYPPSLTGPPDDGSQETTYGIPGIGLEGWEWLGDTISGLWTSLMDLDWQGVLFFMPTLEEWMGVGE